MLKTLVRNPKISKSKLVISNIGALVILLMFLLPEVKGWLVGRHLQSAKSAIALGDFSGAKSEYDAAISTAEWFSSRSEEERIYDEAFFSFKNAGRAEDAAAVIESRVKDRERHYLTLIEDRPYFISEVNRSAMALLNLGPAYYAEARALYEKLLRVKERWYGGRREDSVELADDLELIANTYELERNYRKLFETRRRELAIREKAKGEDAQRVRLLRVENARLLDMLGGERELGRPFNFLDFTFPGSKGNFEADEYPCESFTLQSGQSGNASQGFTLEKVSYEDVNGDGLDDAIVTLGVRTNGSAGVNHVYIFDLHGDEPKLIWGFESGDRAWGGLKDVYGQGGELVVELYGKGTRVGSVMGATVSDAVCCPKSATRTRYKWHKEAFEQDGKQELLPVNTDTATERATTSS
jgi:hypothetical protein